MPEPLPETTLAWLHQSAAVDGAAYSQVLLQLLERVESLERRPTCKQSLQVPPTPEAAPVATDDELCSAYDSASRRSFGSAVRAVYDLGRQHGAPQPPAAQPAPQPAPAGGLVERVEKALERSYTLENDWETEARAAIREVAAWLDSNVGLPDIASPCEADGWEMAAQILNRESEMGL